MKKDKEEYERYKEKNYSLKSWQECVSRISDLPNLKEVSLKFHPHVGNPKPHEFVEFQPPEDVELRTDVLNTVFTALDRKHLNVDALSIEHLQDFTSRVYTTSAFQNVRKKLKRLHLKISMEWCEYGPSGDIDRPEKHDFFNEELNTVWLEPLQSQLTHLSVYGDDFWGVYPRWNPRALHFPRLKSLSLGKWSIAHQWQIDWLLSHSATIEELYLDNCPIVHALRFFDHQYKNLSWEPTELSICVEKGSDDYNDGHVYPPLRWTPILSQFATDLTSLRKFGMATSNSWEHRYELPSTLGVGRYMLFDPATCPTAWDQDDMAKCDDEVDFQSCWYHDWDLEGKSVEKLKFPREREAEMQALLRLPNLRSANAPLNN
jgi:hypothetical protein